jgi:hypothetical protein
MDHEAGGLVEDEEVRVFEEDIERNILRLEQGGLRRRLADRDGVASVYFVARFGGFSRECDVALLDERLKSRAGEMGDLCGEEAVEPVAGGACVDSELGHLFEKLKDEV